MNSHPTGVEDRVRDALNNAASLSDEPVDWAALQRAIVAQGGAELGRRRSTPRRWTMVAGAAAVAAGLALLLIGPAERRGVSAPAPVRDAAGVSPSVDHLLNDRMTDEELRAVLAGADEADALLLLAADERRGEGGEP